MRFPTTLLHSPTVAAALLVGGIALVVNSEPSRSTVYKWTTSPSSNATSDSTINWAEGMAPNAVNDSARAMMAALARWRDDLAGATPTTGSASAYELLTKQGFSSLPAMTGARVCFAAHATNTPGTATLNVDLLGAKPLRAAPGIELAPGAIVAGTPYCAIYNNGSPEWVVTFVNVNTTVPLGGIIDFIGGTVPSSNFVPARGQAISRTTYAALFAMVGTIWGNGDGSTTFNIPDLGGRVVAGTEATAARLTSLGSGCVGNALGSFCGGETVTLATGNIPSLTSGSFSHTLTVDPTVTNGTFVVRTANTQNNVEAANGSANDVPKGVTRDTLALASGSVSGSISYTNASPAPVNRMQPTIVLNKLLRVM